jgi:cysteine desulfurase/selenocysteine lyase
MIYLDNASTSWPKPNTVIESMAEALRSAGGNPGRGQHGLAERAARVVEGARARLAALLGARAPERVVFTLNATDALNMAIKGALAGGGHAVTTDLEHNSVLRPLAGLEAGGRIRVTRVGFDQSGYLDPREIAGAVREETRLVAVTHASNVLGSVQPIAEIAERVRATGSYALVLVDVAQTAGSIPIDVERDGLDLVAGSGHKGLLGPPGTGFLYVSPRARLAPWREGGTGADSASPFQPPEMPRLLEAGTPNVSGLAGLAAGLAYLEERGVAAVGAHEARLADRLLDGVSALLHVRVYGPGRDEPRVAVVALTVEGYDPAELAAVLDSSFGIACRAGLHCAPRCHEQLGTAPAGTIRLSPGPFTSEDEIDAALDALGELSV